METLVAPRGKSFPLSPLESRLHCPRCGLRRVRELINTKEATDSELDQLINGTPAPAEPE